MKRRSVILLLLLSAGTSLWAAGHKEGSAFSALSCGWLGSVKLSTLYDSSEVIRLGNSTGHGQDISDVLQEIGTSKARATLSEVTSSVAVGLESRFMFSEKWGIGSRISLFFPQDITYEVEQFSGAGQDIGRIRRDRGDFMTLLGIDIFPGLSFMPIRTSQWGLHLMQGLHLASLVTDTQFMKSTQVVMGIGTEISADVYFGKHFYLNGGLVLTYDFLSSTSLEYADAGKIVRDSSVVPTAYLSILPKIAIGCRM